VADEQDEVVAAVVTECAEADIPLFLEPVAYELDGAYTPGTQQFGGRRREIVVESARRLGALGPDVLKLQFPVDTSAHGDPSLWAAACAELDAASPVPWALLSGGDPFESFVEQVRIACEAGASGFLVGRALWASLVTAPAAEQRTILRDVVRPRLQELVAVAADSGKDWARRHELPDVDHTSFASSYGSGP
jgi:tagatose 1,6-diphosphate aldolase